MRSWLLCLRIGPCRLQSFRGVDFWLSVHAHGTSSKTRGLTVFSFTLSYLFCAPGCLELYLALPCICNTTTIVWSSLSA